METSKPLWVACFNDWLNPKQKHLLFLAQTIVFCLLVSGRSNNGWVNGDRVSSRVWMTLCLLGGGGDLRRWQLEARRNHHCHLSCLERCGAGWGLSSLIGALTTYCGTQPLPLPPRHVFRTLAGSNAQCTGSGQQKQGKLVRNSLVQAVMLPFFLAGNTYQAVT